MIGMLPKQLNINGVDWVIRSDYRVALLIFQALADPDLEGNYKLLVMLDSLYVDFKEINPSDYEEALKQAKWFLDRGDSSGEKHEIKLLDWEQDEQLIFSAVNKIAGTETRMLDYMHWWTFLGCFNEIDDGLFYQLLTIRGKRSKGKKLEKHEEEFYRQNKMMVDFKTKYTVEELEEIEELERILG